MRKILMLATAAIAVNVGGIEANAGNPNVPSWSPYAVMGHDPAPSAIGARRMSEGRAAYTNLSPAGSPVRSAYTLSNPEGPLNDYYKDVGLSDDINDCNKGCAAGNGS
jgi:hypothetical protein